MGYIAIVDYGAGNLKSLSNSLSFLGLEHRVVTDPRELEAARSVILPGVGAFVPAAEQLDAAGFTEPLREQAKKKPLLGICLGMQLLFELGHETRDCEGLGLIPGEVRMIKTILKLPHIGWNSLDISKPCVILKGVDSGEYVYFVHGFCAETGVENLTATTSYGEDIAAVAMNGNVFGCQFHPEKSGDTGLRILKNFGGL